MTGGLEQTDMVTMLKIVITFVTPLTKQLYPKYLVPWEDIERLHENHILKLATQCGGNFDWEDPIN